MSFSALPGTLFIAGYVASALAASLHALLTKSDPRSAVSWIALCCLFPLGGSILYWLFGINRVATRAQLQDQSGADAQAPIAPGASALAQLVRAGDVLTGIERVAGNSRVPSPATGMTASVIGTGRSYCALHHRGAAADAD